MITTDYNNCIIESIQENLCAAKMLIYSLGGNSDVDSMSCNNSSKCYGIAASILLCSVIDSIGTFFYLKSTNKAESWKKGDFHLFNNAEPINTQLIKTKGTVKQHFEIVRKKYMSDEFNDKDTYADIIYEHVRCGLCHNNTMGRGILLIAPSDNSISNLNVISQHDKNTIVNIDKFYNAVKKAYDGFWKDYSQYFNPSDDAYVPVSGVTADIVYKEVKL